MVPHVKDEEGVRGFLVFRWPSVGLGCLDCFDKEWFDLVSLVTSCFESSKELLSPLVFIFFFSTQGVNPEEGTIDYARQEAWWMGRGWWNVQVKVGWLLI